MEEVTFFSNKERKGMKILQEDEADCRRFLTPRLGREERELLSGEKDFVLVQYP